ncbi:MAG TPA: SDR family oxidoreductase [Chloroflexota bacterium]|jgi:NAD(P)-dependent dehydrogenase (short-subunit alcohol dehydrogenase family)
MDEETTPSNLIGQVAIVTGAGRGLGRVYAQALSRAGAALAITARTDDQLAETAAMIKGAGGRIVAMPADVADPPAVERFVAMVEQQLGPVDLLVNNAGTVGPLGPMATIDLEDWWRTMEVNLRGPLLCSRAVLPTMLRRRRGRIINVSSGAALAPWPLVSAYAVSKAALQRLTENLAAETAEQGVAVFAIHPGIVRTAMTEGIAANVIVPQVAQSFQRSFAEGRDTPPERSAQLIVALASGQADALSGHYIAAQDDLSALIGQAEEIRREQRYTLRGRS